MGWWDGSYALNFIDCSLVFKVSGVGNQICGEGIYVSGRDNLVIGRKVDDKEWFQKEFF